MIPRDKLLHFGAGALAGLSALVIGWYGLIPVVVAGIGKEVYDERTYGGFDWLDAIATFLGGAVSVVLIQLVR